MVLLICAGCSSTPYREAKDFRSVGFSSFKLGRDAWRVRYVGPEDWTLARATDLALLRCAELTAESGFRYFLVRAKSAELQTFDLWRPTQSAIRYPVPAPRSPSDLARANERWAGSLVRPDRPVGTAPAQGTPGKTITWSAPVIQLYIAATDKVPSGATAEAVYEAKPLIAELRAKFGRDLPGK